MIIPTKEECLNMLEKENVPSNIISHLKAVHDFSTKICDVLEKRGIQVNRNLVAAGALLHDIRKTSPNDHIIEGYELVKSLGYPEVAEVIKKHGLMHIDNGEFVPKTWEEKVVFYADKRCRGNKVVNLEERFEYIKQRYKKERVDLEISFTKKIEKELLGNVKI